MSVMQTSSLPKAVPAEDPVPTIYSETTAGWRTGGHNWRFKRVHAKVKVLRLPEYYPNLPGQEQKPYPHPDAEIGLHGFTENDFFVMIGVTWCGQIYYVYNVRASTSGGVHIPFALPPTKVDDVVEMEILHNRAGRQEELNVTVNPGTPMELTASVTIPLLADDIGQTYETDKVFYRHAGWNIQLDASMVTMPDEYDRRFWKFRECEVTSEGAHGEITGAIFSPPHTKNNPDAPDKWATWREIIVKDANPTTDVVVVAPGTPWPADNPVNFGMVFNPEKRPRAQLCTTHTAGWRTGGHGWLFRKISATVTIPEVPAQSEMPELPATPLLQDVYPQAIIALYGYTANPYFLSLGVTGDPSPGGGTHAMAYYSYDIGGGKVEQTPFRDDGGKEMILKAGDRLKMEIDHFGNQDKFTITKEPGAGGEPVTYTHTMVIDPDKVFYRHAGFDNFVHGQDFPLFLEKKAMWFYEDCHVIGVQDHHDVPGRVFGEWETWQYIITRTGEPTSDIVLFPRYPWLDDDGHTNFRMILHEKTETSG